MSTPTKSKAAADKLTEEEMLVLLLAANGGSAPGKKAYEVMVKLDKKGHSIHTFGNYYKALAIKAKALIAEFPDVELVDGAAATPKKGDRVSVRLQMSMRLVMVETVETGSPKVKPRRRLRPLRSLKERPRRGLSSPLRRRRMS